MAAALLLLLLLVLVDDSVVDVVVVDDAEGCRCLVLPAVDERERLDLEPSFVLRILSFFSKGRFSSEKVGRRVNNNWKTN